MGCDFNRSTRDTQTIIPGEITRPAASRPKRTLTFEISGGAFLAKTKLAPFAGELN